MHILHLQARGRWGADSGAGQGAGGRERERVAVSRGPRAAGACGHRWCGCGPIPESRAQSPAALHSHSRHHDIRPPPSQNPCPPPHPGQALFSPTRGLSQQVLPGKEGYRASRDIVPSRSSMVFSSFATDLSANSARVSACGSMGGERVSGGARWGWCRLHCTSNLPCLHLPYHPPRALPWEGKRTRTLWTPTP